MKLITQIYREFKRDNIMFKNNSEKIFLVLMAIMAIALFFTLSGCALLDKMRGGVSPHADVFIDSTVIEVPVVDNTEDIVVPTVDAADIRG